MSFLGGFFLWALPLSAVPVIIHLLHRRRRTVVRWGAMQLLMDSVVRKRRLLRLDDAVLMLLRAAAVAAIVIAFSRPQIRSSVLTGKSPGQDVILILDASLSTGRLQGAVAVFDQIKRKAAEILERLDASDQIRLIVAASAPHWIGDRNDIGGFLQKKLIAERIAELKPTEATADFAACVQSALTAEPSPDATRRLIVVVTDGAAHGWNADVVSRWQPIRDLASRATLPTVINVVTADVSTSPVANLAVEKLITNRPRVCVSEPFTVTARLHNTGDMRCEATTLKWDMDGQSTGESAIEPLEPDQSIEVTMETSCDRTGVFSLRGRLVRDDDLPGDNAASLVIESLERLPILICRTEADLERPKSQPDFLMAALGRGREASSGNYSTVAFEPTFIGIDALAGTDLAAYRCVLFEDVLPKSPDVTNSLADFAAKGGGIWLILGENSTAEQFNSTVFREGAGLAPITVGQRVKADERTEFFTVHPPDGTHPATVLLGDTERLDIDDVRMAQYWRLSTPEATENVSVLLETGDGAPLALEYYTGDGRIIVQAIPNDTKWTNLPVCQAFVPLVQEWLWYLTQPTSVNYNLDPGATIVLSSETLRKFKQARILTALGETVALSAASAGENDLRYRETAFPGNYHATVTPTDGPDLLIPFCVRRDPGESRLVRLSAEQTAALAQRGGLRFTADPLSFPGNAVKPVRYEPFWNYLLGLVALLFVAELVCAYLLARRRYAGVPHPAQLILGGPGERSNGGRQST